MMKKFMIFAVVAGFSMSQAQMVLKAEECASLRVSIDSYFYTQPAVFPNPKKYVSEFNKPFDFACGAIRYVGDGRNSFDVYVSNSADFADFLTAKKRDLGSASLTLGSYLTYKYPSLKKGDIFYFEMASVKPNLITYYSTVSRTDELDKTTTLDFISSSRVAGFKLNGGPLQPFVFEGNSYPINYKQGDVVEIFVKPSSFVELEYLKIDTRNNLISARAKNEFPSN